MQETRDVLIPRKGVKGSVSCEAPERIVLQRINFWLLLKQRRLPGTSRRVLLQRWLNIQILPYILNV